MIPTPVYTTEAHPIGVWQAWYSDNLAAIEDSSKYVFFGPMGQHDGSNDLQQIAVPFYPEWAGPVEGNGANGGGVGGRSNNAGHGGKGSSTNTGSASHDIATVAIPTQPRTPRDTCPATQTSANMRVYAPYEYTDSLNKRVCWTPYFLGREREEFDSHLRMFMNYCRWANMRLRPAPQAERGDIKTEVVVATQTSGSMLSPGTKRPRSNGILGSISEAHDRATGGITHDRLSGASVPSAKRPSYGSVPNYVTAGAASISNNYTAPSYTNTSSSTNAYAPTPSTNSTSTSSASPYTFQQPQQPPYLPPPPAPSSKSTTSLSPSISSGSPNNQSLTSVSSISSPVTSPYQTPQTRPVVSEAAHAAQTQAPGQAQSSQHFYSTYQNYYNLSPQNEFQPFEGD